MIGILEPKDVARELDDRVLKASSSPDERHTSLASVSNGTQRTMHASVRTGWGNPQAIKGHQAIYGVRVDGFGWNPDEFEADIGQGRIGEPVGRVTRAKVADDANQRAR